MGWGWVSASVFLVACGGSSVESPPATTPDASTSTPGPTGGGPVDAAGGSSGPDGSTDAGVDATAPSGCKADCGKGTCFEGVCICAGGAFVQPDGSCGPKEPGTCIEQTGECASVPAKCKPEQTLGTVDANNSCGDLVAAVCCFACVGPKDLVCCGASADESTAAVCVNGWKTCPAKTTPKLGAINAVCKP